jgi:hypothetical protein
MSDLYHHPDEDTTAAERLAYQQGYNQTMKIAIGLECELAAVVAERDALHEENTRLRRAAELGLEYAKGDLAQRKESFAGYPTCWIEEQRDVAFIEAALRGEVQGE